MSSGIVIIIVLAAAIVAAVGGFFGRKYLGEARIASAEVASRKMLEEAERQAESLRREARVELKDELHQVRAQAEAEVRERRQELTQLENRLLGREEALDEVQKDMFRREQSVADRENHYRKVIEEAEALKAQEARQLQEISGLTKEQAAEILLKRTGDEVRHDMAKLVRSIEDEARHEGDRRAKDILSVCIQRAAASHVADSTVSVVHLPSDDMKGRIIGREGRNVRTLENLTGVDFIIDDTPEAVVLSGFDTVRREIARLTLSKLVADGRIHPAKIEEMYSKAREEVDKEAG
jgi:ribonuclease Y